MTGDDVAAAALTWIGTPFHHQGRRKGVGVDCVGLLIGVAGELGILPEDFNVAPYDRVPDGVRLLQEAAVHLRSVAIDEARPGDVVVLRWERDPQHFGILSPYRHGGLSMIHAYSAPGRRGGVTEHRFDGPMRQHLVAVFRFPGIE